MKISENKKAFFNYFIEEKYEAGICLKGWEVKSIRAGKAQIKESYIILKKAELYLIGCHISPLAAASTHITPDPIRNRKLLLHNYEIKKLIGKIEREGYTIVPLNLHFSKGKIKCDIGLAKGKKQYDKRNTERIRDVNKELSRVIKQKRF
tara:strand:- start:82 stop:531 length:450 start_codon:yes stop_codon:yes gene_type:complete